MWVEEAPEVYHRQVGSVDALKCVMNDFDPD